MAVKGQPKIAGATTHFYGNQRTPAAETAVGMIKSRRLDATPMIDTVVRDLIEGVAAKEIKLFLNTHERAARFRARKARADMAVARKGILAREEIVAVLLAFGVETANGEEVLLARLIVEEVGVLVPEKAEEFGWGRALLCLFHQNQYFFKFHIAKG